LELVRREPDFQISILIAEWLASFLRHNYCGLYRFDDLEEVLVAKIDKAQLNAPHLNTKDEVHVASEIYGWGGHTPLMCKLVNSMPSRPDVLITRPSSKQVNLKILEISDDRLVVVTKAPSFLDRIIEIFNILTFYKKIVLHIHPDDIVCAVALRLVRIFNPSIDISLVNHSDHTFSVALGVVDRVFEITAYGWSLRSAKGLIKKSSFMGIPIDGLEKPFPLNRDMNSALSVGASYKYKPIFGRSLSKIVYQLLQHKTSLKVTIIGPKKSDWWWGSLSFFQHKRFVCMSHVSREDYLERLAKIGVYIDSYPISGGTAFPEALLSGAYVLGLKSNAAGSSFADLLRFENTYDLVSGFDELLVTNSKFRLFQDYIREKVRSFHSITSVIDRIELARNNNVCIDISEELVMFHPEVSFESLWTNSRSVYFPRFPKYLDEDIFLIVIKTYIRYFSLFNNNLHKSFTRIIKNKFTNNR
jgi:hypothetical protein